MLLTGGARLLDPCEKESVDAAANLTIQQREDITSVAQVDLRHAHTHTHTVLMTIFRRWKASLRPATVVLVVVVLVVVTPFRKMPKALLIRTGKLRNLAYTFVTSVPPGLPS